MLGVRPRQAEFHREAVVLAHAYALAALADAATTFDQSAAYERLLLRLDWLHGDDTPACESMPGIGRNELLPCAEDANEGFVAFGIDALSIELLLADLEDASMLDSRRSYGAGESPPPFEFGHLELLRAPRSRRISGTVPVVPNRDHRHDLRWC